MFNFLKPKPPKPIEIGSKWYKPTVNPFEEEDYYLIVIDKRDGYIQFKRPYWSIFQIDSMEESFFRSFYTPCPEDYIPTATLKKSNWINYAP